MECVHHQSLDAQTFSSLHLIFSRTQLSTASQSSVWFPEKKSRNLLTDTIGHISQPNRSYCLEVDFFSDNTVKTRNK